MQTFLVQDTDGKYPATEVMWDSHEGAVARYLRRFVPGMRDLEPENLSVRFDMAQHDALLVADIIYGDPDTDCDEIFGTEYNCEGEITLYHAHLYSQGHERHPLGSFTCYVQPE